MKREVADFLEQQADLTKQPFIQNAITERILEKTGGEGLYQKKEFDLSVARTDEECKASGDRLMVETVDDAVTIKLNSRKNPSIDLQKFPLIKSPIKKFYITNAAGSGSLDILVGSKGMFEAKKKLDFLVPATYLVRMEGSVCKAYNAIGDVDKSDTDPLTVIQYAISTAAGGKIVIMDDMVIDNKITMVANTTLEFIGKLTLADGGVQRPSMIECSVPNVTIINPRLDMDRDSNQIGGPGTQMIINITSSSNDTLIIGGHLENACMCGIGGEGENVKIYGTKISGCGEHGIYFNQERDIYIDGVEIYQPGRTNTHGYGMKFRNVDHAVVRHSHVEYTGSEGYTTIGVIIGNGSRFCDIQMKVENADNGVQLSANDPSGNPNRGNRISLDCVNVTAFAAAPANDSEVEYTTVYDSYMDTGNFKPNCFGEHCKITNVHLYDGGFYTVAAHDVSYSLHHCTAIKGDTNYPHRFLSGHDIVITDCTFINSSNSHTTALNFQGVTGLLVLRDSVIQGGTTNGIYFNATPTQFVCVGNYIGKTYGATTPTNPINWAASPTTKRIHDNIGYIGENGGVSGAIADGATIAHGCTGTPTHVSVVGTVAGEIVQATALGAANITVAIKTNAGAAGTNQAIYWRVWE